MEPETDPVDDICKLIVDYSRTAVVGNEQQVLAVILSVATGYAPDCSEFTSSMLEGESSGGKTAVQTAAFAVFPEEHIKDMTSASDKAPIYSTDLRIDPITKRPLSEYIALKLAEYQKLTKPIIEILKSMSGDDPAFIYEVTTVATSDTAEYHIRKMPYNCTYAQQEKDKEIQTRLFLIPVEENVNINKAVILLQYGKKKVTYNGREYNIGSDPELLEKIREPLSALMHFRPPVECEFPDAFIDMVNHSRPESKRHAALISNLLHSSCRLNWERRICRGDTLFVSAQDVVNIISMFDLLQATMMGADGVDIAIYKKLRGSAGLTVPQVIHYLKTVGLTEMTKQEINRRLDKLDNENYIEQTHGDMGITWSANPGKQILTLKVNWDMILEFDDSPVVDPMTGIKYDNIVEYSEIATKEHATRSGQEFQSTVSAVESKARGAIMEHLSNPHANNTRTGVIAASGRICDDRAVGFFQLEESLDNLVNEGHVIYDVVKQTYRNKINEIGLDTTDVF